MKVEGLWGKELDDYNQGEFDLETIETIQKELKIDLPDSYIQLMKKRNGFYLKKKYYPTDIPNSWATNSVHVDFLYGIGENPGILDTIYLRKEWGIRSKKLLIISADAPMFICLDYRRRKHPAVVFIDVEQNQEIHLAKNFEEFIKGLVDHIEEEELNLYDSELSEQEIKDYYAKIDEVIQKGKPGEIDRVFTKILSTNNELIRYMVEKMRQHEKPKVHFYLLLFLSCCAEGENKGIIEDNYLLEVLDEFAQSKNRDVRDFSLYSLKELHKSR
ncbi:SMI1/KNR4 family protein [Lysinibacillus antri]|uniref:SMI1/KNR4 family protein n=1 Tax=Lysinibacillus antri TaxID=2498145 RepID=A0A3S0P4T7_9BACI|nr:SMI1/KNR4 family protein [Lysinibacillus antri]RUL54058.1 SMI1/KNR4 family protein [Lysinibacillus antri]